MQPSWTCMHMAKWQCVWLLESTTRDPCPLIPGINQHAPVYRCICIEYKLNKTASHISVLAKLLNLTFSSSMPASELILQESVSLDHYIIFDAQFLILLLLSYYFIVDFIALSKIDPLLLLDFLTSFNIVMLFSSEKNRGNKLLVI